MYRIEYTPSFKRAAERCKKKHWNMEALKASIEVIAESDEKKIPYEYASHDLKGKLKGMKAVHIGGRNSNWVLVYKICEDKVRLIATGTHDEAYR